MNGIEMGGLIALVVFATLSGWIIAVALKMLMVGAVVGVSIVIIGVIIEYWAGLKP